MNKIHFPSIDSTNKYLKDNYSKLENYTFVSADSQSFGKGRNNRIWLSENGKNILFSLLILDKDVFRHYKELSVVFAYAILNELSKLGLKDLMIKWPNDIYVKDKKICGILLESVCKSEIECLIVGVGINVNQEVFNGEYRTCPTSIKLELNREIDINVLKDNIYHSFINIINDVLNNKIFYPLIVKYDYLKGKDGNYNNRKVKIIGIDNDYSLKISLDDKLVNIYSDEIVL